MVIGGIDEAGRGPVVGPMVMAIVAVDDPTSLEEIGVKDSKQLSPSKREELYETILDVADVVIVKRIEPFVIDRFVEVNGLNRLEAMVASELIRRAGVKKVYIDSPDIDSDRFKRIIKSYVGSDVEIVAEHGADRKYPVVSAASIVAKVERDRIISRMEEVYGRIGSGYPHDSETLAFVENWTKRMGRVPPFVRRSWRTSKRISQKVFQRSLEDFLW